MSIPGSASPLFLSAAAAAAPAAYEISRSLRFNSADSAYLNRTPSSAGNRKTWTWSGWVKRTKGAGTYMLMDALSGSYRTSLFFGAGDEIVFYLQGSPVGQLNAAADYRDFSAWYHLVFVCDTTDATATDRMKLFVNGERVTNFAVQTNPSLNQEHSFNDTVFHTIGQRNGQGYYNDGYLADVHFIDGQALAAADFGEFDSNNVWQPKAYAGTYGTNGFHLDFSDNSSNAALGYDAAGSNDWTVNNLSVAAGAGNDSLIDTPTNYTAGSGNNGGNYCTWNPLDNAGTLANGNLDFSQASAAFRNVRSTFAVSSGKWYWEGTVQALGGAAYIGIGTSAASLTVNIGGSNTFGYVNDGNKQSNNTASVSYGVSYTTGDVIGVAFDADAGTLTFYKNGSSQGQAYSGLTSGPYFFMVTGYNGTTWNANFGQRPFAYTAPSGYKALCTTNLPDPTIADGSTAMDVALYTGNGSTQTISGLEFSPDLVWIKDRSASIGHGLYDTVRGALKGLCSNSTTSELVSIAGRDLTGFTSDGFTLGNTYHLGTNTNGNQHVAWTWDAGTSTVSNTDGSITSSVRANPSVGFSISTFTDLIDTAGSRTWGHGLNAAPQFIIMKARGASSNWVVYHASYGTGYGFLNGTNAFQSSGQWNGVTSTTSGHNGGLSAGAYATVCYQWTPVEGYSAFGSYTGNGSTDGPFVYTGFRPRWVLTKASSAGGNWQIIDTARDVYNLANNKLWPSQSYEENSATLGGASADNLDILSNGFKLRTTNAGTNGSGVTYIYACFSENPFKTARAR